MSALAIFVKTPGLSVVKSRLAAGTGAERAADCHVRCAQSVAAVAVQAGIGPVYWAVAEAAGLNDARWAGLPRLLQSGHGLGERMRSVHDQLCQRHGAGILIGADLPQLEPRHLQAAAHHLRAGPGRGVLGPASDGGFWLFGSNVSLSPAIWDQPHYGGAGVAADFVRAIGKQLNWLQLDTRCDLDEPHDLDAVIDELRRLPAAHPVQADLLKWLSALRHSLEPGLRSQP